MNLKVILQLVKQYLANFLGLALACSQGKARNVYKTIQWGLDLTKLNFVVLLNILLYFDLYLSFVVPSFIK